MATLKRRRSRAHPALSDAAVRKAIARIKSPSQDMVLDRDVAAVTRKVEAMLSRGKLRLPELKSALKDIVSRPGDPRSIFDMVRSTRNAFTDSDAFVNYINELLNDLYVPQDQVDGQIVSPGHVYLTNATFADSQCAAAGSEKTGRLTVSTSMNMQNIAKHYIGAKAGVFINFDTNSPAYGSVNRVTVTSPVTWHGTAIRIAGTSGEAPDAEYFDWAGNVSGKGTIAAVIIIAAYEFDRASKSFQQLKAAVLPAFTVADNRVVDWQPSTPYNGTFGPRNPVSLTFMADPGKTYAVAIFAEVDIISNFGGVTAGTPVPPLPPKESFGWNGMLTADVHSMFVSNVILAK
ncbi:MAG: hypothetical protein ISP49_16635 [Reyranella sp.]|jgi:hypothetical protein|nr:hypothetical protein [Reyranella sp.]MBL6653225.1 hypothetical protein [Reyranella sp.]